MVKLQRLNLILSAMYWIFALLLGFAAGQIAEEFDWLAFGIVLGICGVAYGFSVGIWWSLAWLRRVGPHEPQYPSSAL
jgi:hypothetical protein